MTATILDLRRKMRDILRALDRNEAVTILYRGKVKAVMYPARRKDGAMKSAAELPAFGMWQDRHDLKNVEAVVRRMRKGRRHAV